MTVTSHDVARLAGVSQATVSRALRGDARVQPHTLAKVREAAAALGYVPSQLGRNLSTRATHQIAMVADVDNTLYHQLIAPIHDQLLAHGYRMALFAERGDETSQYERLLDRSVDGAILTTTRLRSSLPYDLSKRDLPFVQLTRFSDVVDWHHVVADNAAGAAAVARLFVNGGHSRIGAVVGPSDTSTARDRESGFRTTAEDLGVVVPSRWVHRGEYNYETGSKGFRALLDTAPNQRPTAIFCANDLIAVGALHAAAELGLRVPHDVSIVGFDDLEMAGWPNFELTTVRVPREQMARHAAELLVQLIDGTVPAGDIQRLVHPVELVLRRTHGPPHG